MVKKIIAGRRENMGILSRKIYKQIEWYLYNYYEIKREVQELKDEIIEGIEGRSYDISELGGGISYHSDPTALKTLKLCKKDIVDYEKWLKIIDAVIKHFSGTEKGRMLQKKYFDELGETHIRQELHIERTTYYRWREEIVIYTAMLAIQEGLIKLANIA